MAKKESRHKSALSNREITLAERGLTVYGQVEIVYGGCRLSVCCSDLKVRVCKIAGRLIGRVPIRIGDIVLVSLRDGFNGQGDIFHKYTDTEVKILRKNKEIPESFARSEYADFNLTFE